MRFLSILTIATLFFLPFNTLKAADDKPVYNVHRLKKPMKIDGDWNKAQWKKVKPVKITNFMGDKPAFDPDAQAKMAYDDENIYIIFQVKDQHVQSLTTEHQGPVYRDACVEFFFAPDTDAPLSYFNIETNAGGAILLQYHNPASKERSRIPVSSINEIELAHSLPKVVSPAIDTPVTWTLEYRIPLSMLKQYGKVSQPAKGVTWKANFYKIAALPNVHYKTWSLVQNERPNFHLPQFFGTLNFK